MKPSHCEVSIPAASAKDIEVDWCLSCEMNSFVLDKRECKSSVSCPNTYSPLVDLYKKCLECEKDGLLTGLNGCYEPGNGQFSDLKECDDNNFEYNDGCTPGMKIETSTTECQGFPS
mmetsp:Transcript_16636/g.14512  ORF Transcript_16636/g.14512 Transcript_16636/m.14512 type:complete len:117 (-) Transcript_16636:655-1005(-)